MYRFDFVLYRFYFITTESSIILTTIVRNSCKLSDIKIDISFWRGIHELQFPYQLEGVGFCIIQSKVFRSENLIIG